MAIINIIQTVVFYLIVLGFLGYGAYKAWSWWKDQKEVARVEKTYLSPEGIPTGKEVKRFYSVDELKRMKGGFY